MLAAVDSSSRQLPSRSDPEVIHRLRQEKRRLQLEIDDLANRLAPLGRLPECLGLNGREMLSRALRCMLSLDGVTPETLAASCTYADDVEVDNLKFIDFLVFGLRQALAPHGISLETRARRGIRMSPGNKARVRRLCIAEAEATGRDLSEYTRIDMTSYAWLPPGSRISATHKNIHIANCRLQYQ